MPADGRTALRTLAGLAAIAALFVTGVFGIVGVGWEGTEARDWVIRAEALSVAACGALLAYWSGRFAVAERPPAHPAAAAAALLWPFALVLVIYLVGAPHPGDQ